METWQILKGQEVITSYTNTQNITYNFPANDTDEDIHYTINYTSDTNTTATLPYTVPKCDTQQCTCDNVNPQFTTIDLLPQIHSSSFVNLVGLPENCRSRVEVSNSHPEWLKVEFRAGNIELTALSTAEVERTDIVTIKMDGIDCEGKSIQVTQRGSARDVVINYHVSFHVIEKGVLKTTVKYNNGINEETKSITLNATQTGPSSTWEGVTSGTLTTIRSTIENIDSLVNKCSFDNIIMATIINTITYNLTENGIEGKISYIMNESEQQYYDRIPSAYKDCPQNYMLCLPYTVEIRPRGNNEINMMLNIGETITPGD